MDTKSQRISRREALTRTGLFAGAALSLGKPSASAEPAPAPARQGNFILTLNTATIRGQKLGIVKEAEIAAKAGYQAIEPWIDSISDYKKGGGSLPELKQRIADLGLSVPSSIGFAQWIAEDDDRRAKGLEQAKRDMELVAAIGGKRLAAPPSGGTDTPGLSILKAAERYRALLDAGDQIGVLPQLELWGFSKNFNRLGECAAIAMESGHPQACVLLDVFHLYKGGTEVNGIGLLNGNTVHVLHMNDYPADPPRQKIDDSYRCYPGDGTAPIVEILRKLRSIGGDKALSLELFSRKYWAMDALEVATAGVEKMKALVGKAVAGA